MWQLFTARSIHTKRARLAAILWTLLIFIACFVPANEIPHVRVPFADKWTHFILFAFFSFFWLMAYPSIQWRRLLTVFIISVLFGWLVEELQGLLRFLGRSKDLMDMSADGFGGLIGVVFFYILAGIAAKKETQKR